MNEFGLSKWIEPKDIVYDDGSYENKVAMFLDASRKLGIDIGECMIVEDSVSGIQSGHLAGCQNIMVIDSSGKAEEYKSLPGVVKVIKNFRFD